MLKVLCKLLAVIGILMEIPAILLAQTSMTPKSSIDAEAAKHGFDAAQYSIVDRH